MTAKHCKYCDSLEHTQFYCPKKPRTAIRRTRLRTTGKYTKRWMQTRRNWLKANWAEVFYCYLCGKRMSPEEVTLDHINSRSRHPELRYELTNLAPACWDCNTKKGSKDLDEMEEL